MEGLDHDRRMAEEADMRKAQERRIVEGLRRLSLSGESEECRVAHERRIAQERRRRAEEHGSPSHSPRGGVGAHHVTAAGGRAWRALIVLLALEAMRSRLFEGSLDVDDGASRGAGIRRVRTRFFRKAMSTFGVDELFAN